MPPGAIYCTFARVLWPKKTAYWWAEAAGVQERAAKNWLSPNPKHPVSGDDKLAVIVEITKRG